MMIHQSEKTCGPAPCVTSQPLSAVAIHHPRPVAVAPVQKVAQRERRGVISVATVTNQHILHPAVATTTADKSGGFT